MYKEALKIAYKAHDGQLRRDSCIPYIVHPLRVAAQFNSDMMKVIAILHDVVEDTDIELYNLEEFGQTVINAIDSLSKRKGEKYISYIKRVKTDELATEIKIADIIDNLSDTLSVQPQFLIDRYNKSLKLLLN